MNGNKPMRIYVVDFPDNLCDLIFLQFGGIRYINRLFDRPESRAMPPDGTIHIVADNVGREEINAVTPKCELRIVD